MALVLKDRVKETCTGTSGDMSLTGAVSGYVAFDADATFDGNTTYYALEDADGTKWEVGLGTLSADSTTLTRTTILANQLGFSNTTTQTFSGGTHTIYCVYPAGKSVHLDGSGVLSHSIVNADISGSAAIGIAKLASSSIGVSDGSSTTEISLGQDIQFRGTSNEVEVAEASGTITVGLPSSITANVTGDVTGNSDSATVATSVTATANNSTDETVYPTFVDGATGSQGIETDTGLNYNPSSGTLTSTVFVGNLTGNVTGNVSGSSGSCTGNAATATLATDATSITVSANNSTDETVYPVFVDGATGSQGAETDTGLTYNPSSGLLTSTAFAGNLTGNVTGNASGTAATVTGGTQASITSAANLATVGTISTGVWQGTAIDGTYIDLEGTEVKSTGESGGSKFLREDGDGTCSWQTVGGGTATAVTVADESSDTTCFPLFVTAATGDLGPKSGSNLTFNSSTGVLTATGFAGPLTGNVTGNADTATNATNATHVAVADNESTDENNLITFIEDASATGNVGLESDGDFHYNPSTGTVTATIFKGNIDAVDGDFDGTLEADAITIGGTALNSVIAGVTVTNATNAVTATNANHVAVADNESTDENNLITFIEDASATGNVGLESDGDFHYNPSTGTVTATIFKGNIDAVDGDFDGTLEADAITVGGTALNTVIAAVTVTNATNAVTATNANHVAVADNESTDENNLIPFIEDASATGNVGLESDGDFHYNPSSGTITATIFKGNIDAVDGDFDGTLEADAITIGGTALDTHIAAVTVTNATNAVNATHVNVADNESTDENNLITFIEDASATGNVGLESDGDFHYNPSTGTVTATIFKGNIDAVDGDFDGTLEADAITVGGTALNTVIAAVTVTNATNAAHVSVADNESTDENNLIPFIEDASATGNVGLESDGDFHYNPSSGTVTATIFKGNIDAVDGDFDGTLEADAITIGGTALDTHIAAVTVTNSTNAVNATHVSVADNESTDENNLITFIEDASATGNVGLESDGDFHYNPSTGTVTATIFKGNIDAVDGDFDGTLEADAITVGGTALNTVIAAVTVTNATNAAHVAVADNESTDENNLITFIEDASATGNVGLESDGDFHYNPSTGTVTATIFKGNIDAVDGDFDGTLEADAITVGGTALNTVIAAVTVTNATNAVTATNANHVAVADNESTDENNLIPFIEDASATGNVGLESDGDFHYNPSSGTITATIFKGNIDAVDGDFDGTLEADAITIGGTAIGSIYSVIAGSSSIVTTGALDSGSITSGFGNIDNGSSSIACGSLDVSDGNITNVGDIDCDSISIADAANGLNIDMSGANNGTAKITLKDNVATALDITEASNSYMKFTTTDNGERIVTNVGVVGNTTALTSQSGSVVINAALGNYFTVATSGNITGLDIQNAVVGQKILIRFAWGGDHSLAFTDTVAFPGNTPPGTTASGVDVIGFLCTTASSAFDGFIVGEDLRSS
jgi:hypothetical protein